MKKLILIAVLAAGTSVCHAAWLYGNPGIGNVVSTPDDNTAYEVHPGWNLDTEDWIWEAASGYNPTAIGWTDNGSAGGQWQMEFHFTKALADFQLTTAWMVNHRASADWYYSTNADDASPVWTSLWHHDDPGDAYEHWDAAVTPLQTFTAEQNVTKVWVRYVAGADYNLETRTDQYMKLNVTTIPEPATLGFVSLFGGGLLWIRRKMLI